MKRGYKKGQMKEYAYRNCPYCGEQIPKTTRTGVKIRESRYLQKKTCGETECYGNSMRQTRGQDTHHPPEPTPKTPQDLILDNFLRGAYTDGNTHDTEYQAE